MKGTRRLCSVRFPKVWRGLFASKPLERGSIGVDIPGRLGNGGEAKAVLE